MLTALQKDALLFVDGHARATGSPPSVREIAQKLHLKSHVHAKKLLDALVVRGYLRRLGGQARAIEVVRMPDLPSAAALASWRPNVEFRRTSDHLDWLMVRTMELACSLGLSAETARLAVGLRELGMQIGDCADRVTALEVAAMPESVRRGGVVLETIAGGAGEGGAG